MPDCEYCEKTMSVNQAVVAVIPDLTPWRAQLTSTASTAPCPKAWAWTTTRALASAWTY